jgi:hypothetical protein
MAVDAKPPAQSASEKKKALRHFQAIDIDAYGLDDEDKDDDPIDMTAADKEPDQVEDIFKAVSSNMLFRNLAK